MPFMNLALVWKIECFRPVVWHLLSSTPMGVNCQGVHANAAVKVSVLNGWNGQDCVGFMFTLK